MVVWSLADCGSGLAALFSFSTTIAISNHHHQCVRQRLTVTTAAAAAPPPLPTRLATIANTSFSSSSSSYTSFPFRFSVSLGPRPSLIQSNESRSSIRRTRHRSARLHFQDTFSSPPSFGSVESSGSPVVCTALPRALATHRFRDRNITNRSVRANTRPTTDKHRAQRKCQLVRARVGRTNG